MSESQTSVLPKGFEDFEPFLDWAINSRNARQAKKMESAYEELAALYELGMANDRLVDVLNYCDQFPFGESLPADAGRLYLIALAMADIRPQIELYGEVAPKEA